MEYEQDSREAYCSRKGGEIGFASHGISVSPSRQGATGQAGRCTAEIPDGGFCTRVLLAPTQGVPELYYADESKGVVARKAERKCGSRPKAHGVVTQARVESDRGLGMSDGKDVLPSEARPAISHLERDSATLPLQGDVIRKKLNLHGFDYFVEGWQITGHHAKLAAPFVGWFNR